MKVFKIFMRILISLVAIYILIYSLPWLATRISEFLTAIFSPGLKESFVSFNS